MLCACGPGSVAWNVLVVMNANVYFNGRTSATIQLGQLRLNPPGLGLKCGKRVERLSDF